jgi:hypothetical protein
MAKQTDQKTDNLTEENNHVTTKPNYFSTAPGKGWLYGAGTFFLLLIVFGLGAMAADHHHMEPGDTVLREPGVGFERRVRTQDGRGPMDSGVATSDSLNRTQGIVTSVNGSSFTIASRGSSTTIETNGSTQYTGGNQVKPNDSVLVFGTNNNGTFTATQIVINP